MGIEKIFYPLHGLRLNENIKNNYKDYFLTVVLIHVNVLIMSVFFVELDDELSEKIAIFLSLLSPVSILSGLLILRSSIKSEAIVAQNYELASRMTRASTHRFNDFEQHVIWVHENLGKSKYPYKKIHVYISVSTPVYGLGADDGCKSADKFLDYLDEWVSHFEKMEQYIADPPVLELCFWNKEANIKVFVETNIHIETNSDQRLRVIRFSDLCKRIYQLQSKGIAECKLYFSNESHTRWFIVKSDNDFGGLIAIFSPLSAAALQKRNWVLVGVSFWDRKAFEDLSPFNVRLQYEGDVENEMRKNHIEELRNPDKWLSSHYGIQGDLREGSPKH